MFMFDVLKYKFAKLVVLVCYFGIYTKPFVQQHAKP